MASSGWQSIIDLFNLVLYLKTIPRLKWPPPASRSASSRSLRARTPHSSGKLPLIPITDTLQVHFQKSWSRTPQSLGKLPVIPVTEIEIDRRNKGCSIYLSLSIQKIWWKKDKIFNKILGSLERKFSFASFDMKIAYVWRRWIAKMD